MKFIFPDSHDLVDPSFDFRTEQRSLNRVRHRDDEYAHQVFASSPYDGVLVSKAIVDGTIKGSGKYTVAQRHRLLRSGIRDFLRLNGSPLETMGDCGAFSYASEEVPPFSVDEVIDFYDTCGFDVGMSVDHVVLGYRDESHQPSLPMVSAIPEDWRRRQQLTLELAESFLGRHRSYRCRFEPMAVVQGWSPGSYTAAFTSLEAMGYRRIALGGLVPLKTHEIKAVVSAIADVKKPSTGIHLLGVTRVDEVARFRACGVTSFDSTSPLLQAFKDAKNNYYTLTGAYPAIRVPQVDGNPKLGRAIKAGRVEQEVAIRLERESLERLQDFDRGAASLQDTLETICEYESLHTGGKSRRIEYSQVLQDAPWKKCACRICCELGVHVIIFRGAERNRRRGFHNLAVFRDRLDAALAAPNEASNSTSASRASKAQPAVQPVPPQ